MNLELLTVYRSPFPKERLGRDHDGGYVTVKIPQDYDLLLSAGLSDDSSFEDHWLERYDARCLAFDGTISRSPSNNPRLEWVPKNVGKSANSDNLKSLLRGHRSIFLKMDIEGHETEWFRSLEDGVLDGVTQMVVEFHKGPYDSKHEEVYEKINRTHSLLHLHANNFSGTVVHEGVKVPIAMECTYVNKRILPQLEPNRDPIPGPHDRPNNKGGADISLNYPPFVQPEAQ